MAGEKLTNAEQQKKSLSEKLWLAYFNQYLHEKNIISEAERNRISMKIESRKASTSRPREKGDYVR